MEEGHNGTQDHSSALAASNNTIYVLAWAAFCATVLVYTNHKLLTRQFSKEHTTGDDNILVCRSKDNMLCTLVAKVAFPFKETN